MAKKEEKVVEEIQPTETKNENKISEPEKKEVKKEGGDMKVKLPKTPKQFVNEKDNEPVKVDLRKKKEEVVPTPFQCIICDEFTVKPYNGLCKKCQEEEITWRCHEEGISLYS